MKISLSLVVGILTLLNVATAQDAKSTTKDDQLVRLISDLTKEHDDAKIQLQDFVLDLETGHAALQILSWQHTAQAKPVIAVAPYSPKMDVKQATQLAKELVLSEPAALTRKMAAALHEVFGQDVYWSKYIKGLTPETVGNFDRERYELVPFKSIKNRKIVDIADEALGNLVDVGLYSSGEIAYCVLKDAEAALRAVPLGAFLNDDREKDWKIELKREQVLQFKPFDPKTTPQQVDRGWKEYVAVRYGRSALQEVSKAPSQTRVAEEK